MSANQVLIVDDEAPARQRLRLLLGQMPGWEVAGEAWDVGSAVERIEGARPDLVLLDIRMPGGDGFEVVRRVGPARMPVVVFVTAFGDRALEAFEIGAHDYLVKPVSRARLQKALERVRQRLALPRSPEPGRDLDGLLQRLAPGGDYLQRITVWQDHRGVLLPVDKIDHIQAVRASVKVFSGGRGFLVRHSIGELAERLDPARFQRIHRSHIVRLDAIRELQSWFHGDLKVVLRDGTELMWSRRFRPRDGRSGTLE